MRPYNFLGFIGVAAWLALLALAGVHGWQQWESTTPLYKALAIVIAGQLALHWIYGKETFLYSAHYGPPLILFSAYACQTRFRSLAIVLAAMLVAIEVANNVPAFLWSAEYVRTLAANAPSP